jgi:hypothetical protein
MTDPSDSNSALENSAPEWRDQERALREERLGLASSGAEPRVAQYRLLARLLAEPVEPSLPDNFAALVAGRAEAASDMADERFELWIQRVLLTVLTLTGLALFGGDAVMWLRSAFVSDAGRADELRAAATARWALAVGVCIALSLLIELWTSVARAGRFRTYG